MEIVKIDLGYFEGCADKLDERYRRGKEVKNHPEGF